MTQEDIKRMAREAGFTKLEFYGNKLGTNPTECLERFAALVAAAEREAMVAEAAKKGWGMRNDDPFEDCVREIVDIRARGNT